MVYNDPRQTPHMGQGTRSPSRGGHPSGHHPTTQTHSQNHSYGAHNMSRHRSEITMVNPTSQPYSISTSFSTHNFVEDDERTPVGHTGNFLSTPSGPTQSPQEGFQEGLSSGPAKYECQFCGKGFTRPSSLKACVPSISLFFRVTHETLCN